LPQLIVKKNQTLCFHFVGKRKNRVTEKKRKCGVVAFYCSFLFTSIKALNVVFDEAIRAALNKPKPKKSGGCVLL